MTLTIEVYEADNDTLVDSIDPGQFLSAKGAAIPLGGSGSVRMLRYAFTGLGGLIVAITANPAIALCEHQRLIRFTDDHDDVEADPFVWTMEIEGIDDVPLSPDEEAGETVTVTGRDWLSARLDKMRVLPDRGLGVSPHHPTRWFNFSADRLRDDDPDGPQGAWPFGYGQLPNYDTDNYFGRPEGFVDTAGPDGDGPEWIWDADTRTAFADAGSLYFRQRATLDAGSYWLEGAADDSAEFWGNGVPLLEAEGVYLGSSVHTIFEHSGGDFLLSGVATNRNALRAGVVFAVWTVSDGMPDTCVMRSDASTCRVLAYPADPPGFTPTEAIRLVLDEWDDTYTPADPIVPSFISASDTASAEVDEVTDITARAPADTQLTFALHLLETYLDIREDPLSPGIDAWIRGTAGTDLSATVILEKGTAAKVTHSERSNERANTAMVSGTRFAPFQVDHPSKGSDETYAVSLDMGEASRATAEKFALFYLDALLNFRHGITVALGPSGPKPGKDFDVYDTVGVLDRDGTVGAHRVASVGFSLDASSVVDYSAELEQPSALLQERLGTLIRTQMPGLGGGRTILPTPVEPSFQSNEKGKEDSSDTWQWDGPLGEIQLYKNGVAITGALIDASDLTTPGDTKGTTVTDAAREYVKKADKFTISAGGGAESPSKVFPEGRWVQELRATVSDDGESIVITVSRT